MIKEGSKGALHGILQKTKDILAAILKGELLNRIDMEKWFPRALYICLLFGCAIFYGVKFDQTMTRQEDNAKALKELEINYENRVFEQRSLNRRSTIASQLEEMGSDLAEPTQAVTIIKLN